MPLQCHIIQNQFWVHYIWFLVHVHVVNSAIEDHGRELICFSKILLCFKNKGFIHIQRSYTPCLFSLIKILYLSLWSYINSNIFPYLLFCHSTIHIIIQCPKWWRVKEKQFYTSNTWSLKSYQLVPFYQLWNGWVIELSSQPIPQVFALAYDWWHTCIQLLLMLQLWSVMQHYSCTILSILTDMS